MFLDRFRFLTLLLSLSLLLNLPFLFLVKVFHLDSMSSRKASDAASKCSAECHSCGAGTENEIVQCNVCRKTFHVKKECSNLSWPLQRLFSPVKIFYILVMVAKA
jgi:hypothetical protein